MDVDAGWKAFDDTVCERELVTETRAQDVDWSRSVPVTDARAHGLYIFVAVGMHVRI